MVSPQLVDVSCKVEDGLCRDILCLVRWVSVRHAVGPSGRLLATSVYSVHPDWGSHWVTRCLADPEAVADTWEGQWQTYQDCAISNDACSNTSDIVDLLYTFSLGSC
jgi:hypothetical protein